MDIIAKKDLHVVNLNVKESTLEETFPKANIERGRKRMNGTLKLLARDIRGSFLMSPLFLASMLVWPF